MTLERFLQQVENGLPFSTDLEKKKVFLKGREVKLQFDGKKLLPKEFECVLHNLYKDYKHSVPSENSSKAKNRFFALPYEELSLKELAYNESREIARAKLELFIIEQVSLGFNWTDVCSLSKKVGWFYQSTLDKDLVLFREWF